MRKAEVKEHLVPAETMMSESLHAIVPSSFALLSMMAIVLINPLAEFPYNSST